MDDLPVPSNSELLIQMTSDQLVERMTALMRNAGHLISIEAFRRAFPEEES